MNTFRWLGKGDTVGAGCFTHAEGAGTKAIPTGICINPDIIPLEEKLRDPDNPINRCIYYDGVHCYFGGECENKKSMKV